MWTNTTKLEVVSYITMRRVPKRAKQLLRDCLERIEILERANASFGGAMDTFMGQIPDLMQREIERQAGITQLDAAPAIKELEDGKSNERG